MIVPFFDFPGVPGHVAAGWKMALERVVDSGTYVGGAEVADFEEKFARWVGSRYCIGVGNGLDAIALALEGLGIGSGAKVGVPAHTFIATWLAVLKVGATPIGFDVDERGQLDLDEVESSGGDLDAVIPVHMHGATVDMSRLMNWSRTNSIVVVEDCAQAHGAEIEGRPVGSWGDAGAFSFYPTKNLGALGDAGAVVTDDESVSEIVRSIGNYGASPVDKYIHQRMGVNSRLDSMQAAILGVGLEHLNEWSDARKAVAAAYIESMGKREVDFQPLIADPDASVWHHFVIRVGERAQFRREAHAWGIATDVHYPRLASEEVSHFLGTAPPRTPTAKRISQECVSLPIWPWMRSQQVDRVCEFLQTWRSRA